MVERANDKGKRILNPCGPACHQHDCPYSPVPPHHPAYGNWQAGRALEKRLYPVTFSSQDGIMRNTIFALALIFIAAPTKAADEIPVWLSPGLPMDAIDQIGAAYTDPIDVDSLVKKRDDGQPSKVAPENCAALEAAVRDGYRLQGGSSPDYTHFWISVTNCYNLDQLRRARPSERSFVRDFALDESAVDYLPYIIDLIGPLTSNCAAVKGNYFGIPLSAVTSIEDISVDKYKDGSHFLNITTREWVEGSNDPLWGGISARLRILAKADFNGDGIEDLMLSASGSPVDWFVYEGEIIKDFASYVGRKTLILTRFSDDEVLQILEGWSVPRYAAPDVLDRCDRDLEKLYRELGHEKYPY